MYFEVLMKENQSRFNIQIGFSNKHVIFHRVFQYNLPLIRLKYVIHI